METKQFYYGTSTINSLEDWIAPSFKACKRGYKKISITNSLEAAKYYAERAALNNGGDPVVYEVVPDRDPLRRNKTDWTTNKAKIIKIMSIDEVDEILKNI